MYQPTLEEARRLAKQYTLIPVYREIVADMETPVSAYLKVARGPYSFLLESVEGGERVARYSFIGTEPRKIVRTGPGKRVARPGTLDLGEVDPLRPIEEELARHKPAKIAGLPRFHGGTVGYLSYEAVRYFEKLPVPAADPNGLPESIFMLTDTLVVFDHLKRKMLVVSHADAAEGVEASYAKAVRRIDEIVARLSRPLQTPVTVEPADTHAAAVPNMSQAQHAGMVLRSKEYITAGDIIQAVVSQRLKRKVQAHPFDIYRALRTINPSPYMFYLDLDSFQLVGASPEMLVQVEEGRVSTNPIAGTRPRGTTEAEDTALAEELRGDEKEVAEHVMLLDLGRNDIGRVSKPGTVTVNQMLDVERFSHVMHLVSRVSGELRDDKSCFDALRACFPAGTVSGAPKIRAMEIIASLEPHQRGPYSGAVGYFDFSGNMDTCIALRTLVVKDGHAYLQAGGGIVYDSVPETEYHETLHKMAALQRAIDVAEGMEQRYGPLQNRQEVAKS